VLLTAIQTAEFTISNSSLHSIARLIIVTVYESLCVQGAAAFIIMLLRMIGIAHSVIRLLPSAQ